MSEAIPELAYEEFVRARKLFWKQEAKSLGSDVVPPESEKVQSGKDNSNFILYSPGPNGIFAVFEDSAETGWFYVYAQAQKKILRSTHVYNRSNVAVEEDEVDVGWAADDSACGLAVFGQFRAFLGVSSGLEIRKPVMSAGEDGICSQDWPSGFEHYLENRPD
jgi:Uncharacterized protein conserved in bacteria (DUF2251)